MEIGWIDFSKDDRNKVLDVIHLLQEEGTVDQLGIGIIRDGFANYFFPGTSTVQTRAKYFLIVPYAIKEVTKDWNGKNVTDALRKLDDVEHKCGLIMYYKADNSGVIGKNTLPYSWVSRTPSNIYWNGIKTYNIFKHSDFSIAEYFRYYGHFMQEKKEVKKLLTKSDTENIDDSDAGDITSISFLNIPTYKPEWMSNLDIHLTVEEANFLKKQIVESVPNSLLSFVLTNNIDLSKYETFAEFSNSIFKLVSDEMKNYIKLANDFNDLVYFARVRYNYILSEGKNEFAVSECERLLKNSGNATKVDIQEIFDKLRLHNPGTKDFLRKLQKYLLDKDLDAIDKLIINREISIKNHARAKLNHIGETSPDECKDASYLDYRFHDMKRIVLDILNPVEEGQDNV